MPLVVADNMNGVCCIDEHGTSFIFGSSYHRSLHLFAHSQCPNMLFAGAMFVYESLVSYGLQFGSRVFVLGPGGPAVSERDASGRVGVSRKIHS